MNWTRMNDGELAERFALEGEDEPFRELVQRHGAMVLRVCRRVTTNPHDAEDAAQQVFVILCARASELASCRSLAGWLYNTAWHVGRRMQRSEAARLRHESRAARQDPVYSNGHADEDELRKLYRAIEMLPHEYCEAIVLHHLQGLTVQQVAELMACSEGTTAARLSRGRAMIRERLARCGMVLSVAALESLLIAEAIAEAELQRPLLAGPPAPDLIAAMSNAQWSAAQRAAASVVLAPVPVKSAAVGTSLLLGARGWVAACVAGATLGLAATSAARNDADSRPESKRSQAKASASAESESTNSALHVSSPHAGRTSVPEPTGLLLVAGIGLALSCRRRRT
jgi:RNA polymerase sigma factor (sigma-70 family)